MEVSLANYPESLHDELEAYPLRLDVAALPERRFFKMIRTLTVSVVLLGALLIVLGVFINYQITHMDVTVRKGNVWQFYRLNPLEKRLQALEPFTTKLTPERLFVESKLREYLVKRNSTVWDKEKQAEITAMNGLVAQVSSADVFARFRREYETVVTKTRSKSLIREPYIYDVQLIGSNLWVVLMEVFDLPVTNDLVSVCHCMDNSKQCLQCKLKSAKNRERYKIWIRTSFKNPKVCKIQTGKNWVCDNPLGIRVESYIQTFVPISESESHWSVPPALHPDL